MSKPGEELAIWRGGGAWDCHSEGFDLGDREKMGKWTGCGGGGTGGPEECH